MKAVSFARLSARGRGALALVEITGPGSRELLERHFVPAREGSPLQRATFGRFIDEAGDVIDDGFVMPNPGDAESFLLTLHGNPILLERLCDVFQDAGGEPSREPGAWLRGKANAIEQEALELLPRARTAAAAAFLLQQCRDGLGRWAREIGAGRCETREQELREIIARARAGRGLFEPRRVVLAGVPNAGKSTLFNTLLGRRRVVAHPQAGTTRDLIEEETVLGEFPIRLVDGAGLRDAVGELEREGVRRMRAAVQSADLVVRLVPPQSVMPAGSGDGDEVRIDAGLTLQIASRADQIMRPCAGGPLRVSARTGEGVEELQQEILGKLFDRVHLPSGITPFTERQETVLRSALAALEQGEPADVSALIHRARKNAP